MSEPTVDDLAAILDERFGADQWMLVRHGGRLRWFTIAPGPPDLPGAKTIREALEALEMATRPEVDQ